MNFNKHLDYEGLHAPFSASKSSWLRYDDDKVISVVGNLNAKAMGTKYHEWAKQTIDLGIKQSRTKKTLNMYVNDAIGFKMDTEVVLWYSPYFFGTSDAICFRNNFLRIHDLKTGVTPAHMDQLMVYAALFCLEYKVDPKAIEVELRIYQTDEITIMNPEAGDIQEVMDIIVHIDELIRKIKAKEI